MALHQSFISLPFENKPPNCPAAAALPLTHEIPPPSGHLEIRESGWVLTDTTKGLDGKGGGASGGVGWQAAGTAM